MHNYYHDILSRIPTPPKWYDEHAVPRYENFHPEERANIYAHEVCLFRIECQACGRPFDVVRSWTKHEGPPSLSDDIRAGSLVYGDPPNIDCCPAGPSMSSDSKRVLQFWLHDYAAETSWVRVPELEIEVPDF